MSSRRKSGRITNKTLGKFTNTEDDPINLDSAESSKKKILKRKIKEKTGKLKLTDTESEEVPPREKKGKKNKGIVRFESSSTKGKGHSKKISCVGKEKKKETYRVEEGSSEPSRVDQKKKGKEKMYETETETEEDVVGKPKKKQRRLIHESNVSKKWMVLNTRSSPAQLFRCIKLLRENQRESVKRMGFAKLLSFNLDETYDASVSEWRAKFDGKLLATRTLVEKIESAEDEDNFEFRMNFIMLFMTMLVECHKNGRAREGILRYITAETDFSQIDWCNYVFESIKSCKLGWSPDDNSSPFNGPLAILTVDIEGVKKMLVQWEETKNNIEMHLGELVKTNHDSEDIQTVIACYESLLEKKKPVWPHPTIQNDNVYETVDGYLNDLCVNLQDLGDETAEGENLGDETVGVDLCMGKKGETSNLSSKEAVMDLNINIPELNFTEHPDLKTGRKVVVQDPINEGDLFNGPNWSLGITQNDVQEIEKGKDVTKTIGDVAISGIDLEGPNWSLGVSQIGTTTCLAENVVEKEHLDVPGTLGEKKTEVGANKEKGRPEETLAINLNHSVEAADAAPVNKKSEEIEKMDVNLNESVEAGGAPSEKRKESVTNIQDDTAPHDKDKDRTVDAKWHEIIAKFEATKVKPIREKGIADVNKSPYLIRCVDASKEMSKDEESIINFIWCGGSTHKATDNLSEATDESKKKLKEAVTENNDERKVVYHSVNHLVLERVHLFSLRPDNEVNNQIIDAWAEVLNLEEKYRSTGSSRRLFCGTSAIKDVFVQYMKQIQHPKTDDIHATPVQKLHLPWATKTNTVDCAVFVMRHMERFMGLREQFNYGFSTNGKKKKSQLNLLRKRILLHLLRSEVNVLRDTILLDARKK
ncbi:hypothetical protein E3N88_18421 [Mikania micrantha]|uniref:Ubiquitin-like protease family profile domain-containing protein n=1 Tax=Mikania micrantha TaxID=192012 RepID=A0A5N6NMT6_9ASTR|nr:hypothetical protein E3N88_18421 [Mikania micrantha]